MSRRSVNGGIATVVGAVLDSADIVYRYKAGETTQGIGNRYGICETRAADVLREQGVGIRRRG